MDSYQSDENGYDTSETNRERLNVQKEHIVLNMPTETARELFEESTNQINF